MGHIVVRYGWLLLLIGCHSSAATDSLVGNQNPHVLIVCRLWKNTTADYGRYVNRI
jgi:hypothetical protein